MTCTEVASGVVRSAHLPAQRELWILMFLPGFADLKLVVTDPVLTAVGLHRPLKLGDRKEVRPERVRTADVLTHMPSRVAATIGSTNGDRPQSRRCRYGLIGVLLATVIGKTRVPMSSAARGSWSALLRACPM